MVDVFAVAEIIVQHIKNHYPQDVAIVGYYGSYLQGRATERSDLDFFFIPATERGRQVECQFIIDGIGFDFWPIGWDRAERMARSEEWNTTIIADCELLYVRSENDLARFMELRETISNMGDESKTSAMISQAESVLKDCLISIAKMRLTENSGDLSYLRIQAQAISGNIFKALGFLNQIYYKRSWGHYREQVRNLPMKPEQLDQYLDIIMFSTVPDELMSACENLTADTLRLISERHNKQEGIRSYKERMKGYYEEERAVLNKLLTACEKGHYETAFFVAAGVQDALSRILYAAEKGRWPGIADLGEHREFYVRYGYPDLAALLDPSDFEPLRLAVLQLIEKLENHLNTEGVPMNQFGSVPEFESFYKNRWSDEGERTK
ncbi:nucleotidyltransferase domain-containing protein [Paenibacillus dakarensis]|uniref:nucleotidyltransferase domain-containing protein n=1 Tax=Paenibacillus dakarensis TaxID=1527293 RepID=UPI0006D555FA|nr:nucleotidyltransferase domain-containing protein [Paenibacillus dakarensis]